MPTQAQFVESDIGKAEALRIREHFSASPFWQAVTNRARINTLRDEYWLLSNQDDPSEERTLRMYEIAEEIRKLEQMQTTIERRSAAT